MRFRKACDVSPPNRIPRLVTVVILLLAWIFRMDLAVAAVASQANVGGSTTALALAKSLGREDLLLPGILLGAFGSALCTFAGFLVVRMIAA